MRLYSQALELEFPDDFEEKAGEGADDVMWRRVYERCGALPFNYYSETVDPHVVPPGETSLGDLADDIADIHRDLSEGLSLFDAQHVADAQWSFVWSFRNHWGEHASSAIRALHQWLETNKAW